MVEYKLVYDFASLSFMPRMIFLFIPLIIFFGSKYIIYQIDNRDEDNLGTDIFGNDNSETKRLKAVIGKYFSAVMFIILLLFYIISIFKTYKIYNSKELLETEGYVSNYHPMPSSGHDTERFTVNNINFAYSDYVISDLGYSNAKSKGGAISDSLYVRIHYYESKTKNVILKLEIRK